MLASEAANAKIFADKLAKTEAEYQDALREEIARQEDEEEVLMLLMS